MQDPSGARLCLRLQPLLEDVGGVANASLDLFLTSNTTVLGVLNLQDPSGARVRLRLQPLLQDVASSLLQQDSPSLFSLSSPLGLTGGVPLLPVSTAAFTRERGLQGNLGLCVWGGGGALRHQYCEKE
jgi:hypothetical protein